MHARRFSIFILCLVVLLVVAALVLIQRNSAPPEDAPPLLLISIDGFRHDYFDLVELPALERLAAEGLRADSMQLIFPTKTFATHYSLVTGLYAENSGVVANSMWDPLRKSRFSLGNRDAIGDGYWYDGEPIWNTVEKAGKTAATYFWPGSEAQIGGIRPTIWKPYAGDTPHDERVDQVLAWLDQPVRERAGFLARVRAWFDPPAATRPDFLTLYFSAVDSAGHAHGPGHPRVIEAMVEVDRALGRLLDGLDRRGLYGNMHVLVTSDHGMQQIDLDRYVLLDKDLGLDLGRVNVSDWGPAAQIWSTPDGMSAEQIYQALSGAHPRLRVWKKGEAPARYHFDDHQRIPDVTVEADLGWMISNQPYYAGMQRGVLNGMHGWDPAWHNMHGIFVANGPAFVADTRLPAVRSVDLYSLMAELMQVEPAANDGSLTAFEPALFAQAPVQRAISHWQCQDRRFEARLTEGAAALHSGERVFALPRAISASGARYADTSIEFWNKGDAATIEIEDERWEDCVEIEDGAG